MGYLKAAPSTPLSHARSLRLKRGRPVDSEILLPRSKRLFVSPPGFHEQIFHRAIYSSCTKDRSFTEVCREQLPWSNKAARCTSRTPTVIPASISRSQVSSLSLKRERSHEVILPLSKKPYISPPDSHEGSNIPSCRSPIKHTVSPSKPSCRQLSSSSVAETDHPIPTTTEKDALRNFSAPEFPIIRMRTSFSYSQLQILEDVFSQQDQISEDHALRIAEQFQLPVDCIGSWFSNRRHLQRKRDQRKLRMMNSKSNSQFCAVRT